MRWKSAITALLVAGILGAGCETEARMPADGDNLTQLGPVDGRELPPVDTGRVEVGDLAPDFSLMSYGGTSSRFRTTVSRRTWCSSSTGDIGDHTAPVSSAS